MMQSGVDIVVMSLQQIGRFIQRDAKTPQTAIYFDENGRSYLGNIIHRARTVHIIDCRYETPGHDVPQSVRQGAGQ